MPINIIFAVLKAHPIFIENTFFSILLNFLFIFFTSICFSQLYVANMPIYDANNIVGKKWNIYLDLASQIIKNKKGSIKIFTSSENWFGMTYPEDREIVKSEINKKIRSGYYPEKLWEK